MRIRLLLLLSLAEITVAPSESSAMRTELDDVLVEKLSGKVEPLGSLEKRQPRLSYALNTCLAHTILFTESTQSALESIDL